MAWRLAQSLDTLRDEVNGFAPTRSKASDGTIGDPAHASRASRHNPNRYNVVTALDLTHDPAGGCDIHAIARRLVKDPHPELAYIISNAQVAKRTTGFQWVPYTGSNPHRLHAHFAVGVGPDSDPLPPYDSLLSWGVSIAAPPEEGFLAALTDTQQKQLYERVMALVPNTPRKVVTTGSNVGTPSTTGTPAAEVWRWQLEVLNGLRVLLGRNSAGVDPKAVAAAIVAGMDDDLKAAVKAALREGTG